MKVNQKTRRNTKLFAVIAILVGIFMIGGSVTALATPGSDLNASDPDGNAGCGNSDGSDEANGCDKRGGGGGGGGGGDTLTCTAPEVLNEAGDACVDPSGGGGGGSTLTCDDPQVLNEAGDACVDPSGGGSDPINTGGGSDPINTGGGSDPINTGGGSDPVVDGSVTEGGSGSTGGDTGSTGGSGSSGDSPFVFPPSGGSSDDDEGGSTIVIPPVVKPSHETQDDPFHSDDSQRGGEAQLAPQSDSLPGLVLPAAEATGSVLPFTGTETSLWLALALGLIGSGAVVLVSTRKTAVAKK